MRPALSALVLCAMLLSACGSGGTASENTSEPGKSASPSASYFVSADAREINATVHKAEQASAKAVSRAATAACNRARSSYAPWRTCWHGLLEPVKKELTALATAFGTLAGGDFPEDCVATLGKAQGTFKEFVPKVDKLLAGIDSERRAAQVTAMTNYTKTIESIYKGFTQPFLDLTQVCYSPEVLASLNASPSASPSKAP